MVSKKPSIQEIIEAIVPLDKEWIEKAKKRTVQLVMPTRAQNTDEALILNPDHTVSETNTDNILLVKDKTVIRPISAHVLPDIMELIVCRIFSVWDYNLKKSIVQPEDLFDFDDVLITNSLIGAVPVLRLG